jgi:hypothetical protein
MGRTVISAFAVAVAAFAPSTACAWVFGLQPHADVRDLRVEERMDNGVVRFQPPQPNPLFVRYLARVNSAGAICKIVASSRWNESDSHGTRVVSQYQQVRSALNERYGEYEEFDFVSRNSIWREPRHFAMSLSEDDRSLVSFWTTENGSILPDGMTGISLTAAALSMDTTLLYLSYEFEAMDDCKAEQERRESRGL